MNYTPALAVARDSALKADRLLRDELHRPRPEPFWPVNALVLAERLLLAGRELSVGH
jgi:hypothetical protein